MNIKAEQIGSTRWRVLAIPFGGPFKGGTDLDGERFTPDTDVKADWFQERPTIWHHGRDEALGDDLIGIQTDFAKSDEGWWGTVWLDRSNRYWQQVDAMLRAGKAFGSSGTMPHLVKRRGPDILTWPHIEQTLTTTPINFYARAEPIKALDHFNLAGIALDDATKALLATAPTTDLSIGGNPSGALSNGGDALTAKALDDLMEAVARLRRNL